MIIFVSDIYGASCGLTALIEDLALESGQYHIVAPYEAQSHCFADEGAAYGAFQDSGGLEKYMLRLAAIFEQLSKSHQNLFIIGFSAGAAATYKALNFASLQGSAESILFYPGQIRFYLQDSCVYPTTVVFPKSETHFELAPVAEHLAQQAQIKIINTDYQHGFMNRLSPGFNSEAYAYYRAYLRDKLPLHSN